MSAQAQAKDDVSTSSTSTTVPPPPPARASIRTKSTKKPRWKKIKLPTYVGYDIPVAAFIDLAFSFPSNRDLFTSEERTYLRARWLFPRSGGSAPYKAMLHPEFKTDGDASRVEDSKICFFRLRSLRPEETYDPVKYTLDPTEEDQKALAKFKRWVEKAGGEFDPANATFRAVPPVFHGDENWGYFPPDEYCTGRIRC